MRLTALEPQFLKIERIRARVHQPWPLFVRLLLPFLTRPAQGDWWVNASFESCDGIEFLCPKCYSSNRGAIGTHHVICWKPHVPQEVHPRPGRWGHTGTGLQDLSLVAGSSSVQLMGGCNAHFFVENGAVRDA